MNKLEALKAVWQTAEALGWHVLPTIVALGIIAVGRMVFEDDILDINSSEAKRRHSVVKVLIILVAFVVTLFMQFSLSRADDMYDYEMSIGMAIGYTVVSYVAYSFLSALYTALNPVQLVAGLIRKATGQESPK